MNFACRNLNDQGSAKVFLAYLLLQKFPVSFVFYTVYYSKNRYFPVKLFSVYYLKVNAICGANTFIGIGSNI